LDFTTDDLSKKTTLEQTIRAFQSFGLSFSYDIFHEEFRVGDDALYRKIGKSIDNILVMLRRITNRKCNFDPGGEKSKTALITLCLVHAYNPVLDYLDRLKWDHQARVDTWLTTYYGVEDTPLNRAIGRKVLMAAVRRVREPGTKFDNVLILEGAQD